MPVGPTAKMAVLRCGHSLAIQINFADAFYPREDVIHSLAAESHQLRADNARHEITLQLENLLRRQTVEPLAKNGRHRASKSLHFRTDSHSNVRVALLIDLQINADCVGAFLVFSNIDKIKILSLTLFLPFRIICIRNQRLAPLILRQGFKKVDDLVQFRWMHEIWNLPRVSLRVIPSEVEEPRGEKYC